MDSTSGFHAIINLFLIPLWLLSGSLFPVSSASPWMAFLMRINPLTYGTEALRGLLFPATALPEFAIAKCLAILVVFTVVMFGMAFVVANRRSTKPAA
jgi:ABC-2 type transport system permease protein